MSNENIKKILVNYSRIHKPQNASKNYEIQH